MIEDVVAREYERLIGSVEGFCNCEQCHDDVLVYALNRLPPRYVAHRTGEILTNVSLESDQPRADISVMLLDAMRRVKAEPHPECRGSASS